MKRNRERLTWAAGRKASAPPATPGYGVEDQDHPAYYADPDADDYENGDTSSWAEDPRTPPYPQGNPPSTPGYDVEDQDHPAYKRLPRVPKEASIREAIKRKAAKAVRVARLMLGEYASDAQIEDQALDLMDLPDEQLTATLNRVSGNPMVAEEEVPDESQVTEAELDTPMEDGDQVTEAELDALLAEGESDEEDPVDEGKAAMEALSCKIAELQEEIEMLKSGGWKAAGQNAPGGSQNGANAPGKDEDEARAEGKTKTASAAKRAARAFFASMDTDGDGFVLHSEWIGNPAIFSSADKDKDGIVSEEEVVEELTKKKAGDVPEAFKKNWDKDEKKKAASDEEEEDVEEDVEEDEEASDESDESEEEKKGKKACGEIDAEDIDDASLFGLTDDPMGLGESPVTTPEEDALLASVFGRVAKKGEEEEVVEGDEEAVEGEEKEVEEKVEKKASRTASQKPQPRKASVGPKTIGTQVRIAGVKDEVSELSRLWESAPDVSEVFGLK